MSTKTFPTVEVLLDILDNGDINDVIEHLKTFVPEYPKQPGRPKLNVQTPTSEQALQYINELKAYEAKTEEYTKSKELYEKGQLEFNNLMEEVVKRYTGFYSFVPEQYQSKVWYKAWQDGHSEGYSSVSYHLTELIEIFE